MTGCEAQNGMSRAMDGASSSVLEVTTLTKRYGDRPALRDVGLAMREGEVLGLIGPNGAGKTTLLESIAGLLPIDSGTVFWAGRPLPPQRRREVMFYLPDGIRPYGDQFVTQVLTFFADTYRRTCGEVTDIVSAAGLAPVLGQRVQSLSKGFNRRLLIALGLLTPHPLLMMDEPFDGLDLRQTRDMMGVLRRVASAGRTLLLSIHQLRDAEAVCDRFALLADGRIRGVGTLSELRAQAGRPTASLEDVILALT
jgi:ABC-type multidrug transport system ATPase subunit